MNYAVENFDLGKVVDYRTSSIPAYYLGSNKMAESLEQVARALLMVFRPLVPSSLLTAVF